MTETDAVVAAQAPGVFDVLSFVEGTAYPTETVVVYQDAKSATELIMANKERLAMDVLLVDDYENIDERITKLTEAVKSSALRFNLRGMPPGVARDVYNPTEGMTEEENAQQENDLIAKTIVSVQNAQGAVDGSLWDAGKVATLRRFLKEGEFNKLVMGVSSVNFNAAVFDQAVDAGFLSRDTDLA